MFCRSVLTLLVCVGSLSAQLTITTSSPLTPATLNSPYAVAFTATGGTGTLTWILNSGSPAFPPGLTLSTSGTLSGTVTGQSGSPYNFTIRVTDSASPANTTTKSFTLVVNPPAITSPAALPTATVSVPYTFTFTATGGTSPYTYTKTAGLLPAGLALSGSTINGTPTSTAGAPFDFTIQVNDSAGQSNSSQFSLSVNQALSITTTALPAATKLVSYVAPALTASGGTPPYTFSNGGGALPPGLSLDSTGAITGTPTDQTQSPYSFTARVTDSTAPTPVMATKTLSIVVNPPIITTASLPAGAAGVFYSVTLGAAGGTPPFGSWTATGSLPSGMALNSGNGILSGTPASATGSPFLFTVQTLDSAGQPASKQFTLTIGSGAISISTPSPLPPALLASTYSQTLSASGGAGSLTWTLANGSSLPPGLLLSTAGVISGTPTSQTNSPYAFTVQVSDTSSPTPQVATKLFTMVVNPPIVTTSTPLPSATVGVAYSTTLAAAGGSPPYTWSGTPPGGLTLSASTGAISGTPTTASGSPFTFTITATDSANSTASKPFMLSIATATLTITTSTPLPLASVGTAYSATLAATGGSGTPIWSLASGSSLPTGLSLSQSGMITGTPGSQLNSPYVLTVQAADGASPGANIATKQFTLVVNPPLITTASPLAAASVGSPYQAQLTAAGGTPPYTSWSASGAVPGGLALTAGGVLAGTPTASGTFSFNVTAIDSAGAGASKAFQITVGTGITIATASLPDGVAQSNYSATLQATGGQAPYTWSVSSNLLPPGLNLNPATGVLSGVPTATGQYTFTLRAADSGIGSNTRQYTVNILSALNITTASLPDATVGQAYSQTLGATGGNGNYTWSINSEFLPSGLILSATGIINGTPATAGAFTFTVRVADGLGVVATRQFTLTVIGPLSLITTSLPAGTVGSNYSATLTAGGGTPPYQWSIQGSPLPAGLSLNAATGLISGTVSLAGSYGFTVQVADSAGGTASRAFSIVFTSSSTLNITTASLPGGVAGTGYSQQLNASSGTPPYTWGLGGGALPQGLAISSSGLLNGTPSASGPATFSIEVRDSTQAMFSKQFSMIVAASALSLTTLSLPNAVVGQSYSQTLAASGGVSPYAWSITGVLPPGLTLNAATGVVSGTPASAGQYGFSVTVNDSAGLSAVRSLSITAGAGGSVQITTTTVPNAVLNASYTAQLTASGGTAPYFWSVDNGRLPPGVTLGQSGVISGTATAVGVAGFVVRVIDNTGAQATRDLTLTVVPPSVTITTTTLPSGVTGVAYSRQFAVTGGSPPYVWSVSPGGQLPAGLSLSSGGVLAGTPTAAGTSNFTVRVIEGGGGSATQSFQLVIGSPNLTVLTTSIPAGNVGTGYNQQLTASGGVQPYTWSLAAGTPNAGLTLSTAGAISGTPTTAGASTFTVRVTDGNQATATQQLTLTVGSSGLSIITMAVPNGGVGTPYTQTLTVTGGTAPYTWSSSGNLPPGLTINSAGILAGTPATPGSYTFTARVTDSRSATAMRDLTMTVTASVLSVSTTALPNPSTGQPYSALLQAAGGTAPYQWSLAGGSLPAGLLLTAATGAIAGTPTAAGTFNFIAQVTDSVSATATKPLTLTIAGSLQITTAALAGGSPGTAYSDTLRASGGSGAYSWSVPAGTLPPGLLLNPGTGAISGTPTTVGISTFSVQVTDTLSGTTSKQLSITIAAGLSISTGSLPNALVGQPYNQTLNTAGSSGTLTWNVSVGTLPPGLTLGTASGILSGTPTTAGTYSFTARVVDAASNLATRAFTLVITEALSITTPATLPSASVGAPYSHTLAATGGAAPYTWTVSVGSLPAGLTLSPAGVISGGATTAGVFSFIVQAADSASQTASRGLTVTVIAGITISSPTQLPPGTVRTAYSTTLAASGGTPPYAWTLAPGGTLPLGLTLSREGVLSGTPTVAATSTFSVQVTDNANVIATKAFSLTIAQAVSSLSITTSSALPDGIAGVAYAQTLAATGGQAPYTWSVASDSPPAGLSLTPAGVLTGTPSQAGSFTFSVRVIDTGSGSATATFTVAITAPAFSSVSITGLTDTVEPKRQPQLNIGIAQPYPLDITGQLVLSFAPDAATPLDDPTIQFLTGGRTVNFTIPVGASQSNLRSGFALQTGTVAGSITLTVNGLQSGGRTLTPDPAATFTTRIPRAAPVIQGVTLRTTATGFDIEIVGFTTTRELTQAVFLFTLAAGSTPPTTQLTANVSDGAQRWFQDSTSRPFGSLFTLVQSFNVQGGNSGISSVAVTLSNTQGASQPFTATF